MRSFSYFFFLIFGKISNKFTDSNKHSFPISHTCYNQIEMPRYDSYYDFKEKLLTAKEVENFGFL